MSNPFLDALSKTIAPQLIDTFTPLGYSPHAQQEVFHSLSRQRINAILYGGAAGGGKGVLTRTFVPTPQGFVYIDDIAPGDYIYGSDGLVYPVLGVSGEMILDGWKFVFDDGSEVTTDDNHIWKTFNNKELAQLTRLDPAWRESRKKRRKSRALINPSKGTYQASVTAQRNRDKKHNYQPTPEGTLRTTSEIAQTCRTPTDRANHAVRVCAPVQSPDRDLIVDPYLLGMYLGDGISTTGEICCGPEDYQNSKANLEAIVGATNLSCRFKENAHTGIWYLKIDGFKECLQLINVLNNKHVPHNYLWASESQRLALLQGLLDSDGNGNDKGTIEFSNTNQNLTESVAHLARSLGIKVNIRTKIPTLYGKPCSKVWCTTFAVNQDVFRLKRKSVRLNLEGSRKKRFRYLQSVERVEQKPFFCLKVGSPDGMFLVTEHFIPTHNSAALLMEAIHNAVNYPGMRIACIRRTYNELGESFIAELIKREYAQAVGARWNESNYILRFPNRSMINFTYAESEKDASRLLGGEYQLFCIDEATLMPETVIQRIEERLRSGRRDLPVIGLRLATNPGGMSHRYIKERFIKPTLNGKNIHLEPVDKEGKIPPRTIAYVPAKYSDNPYIDQGYESVLAAIPDPQRQKAMRDGDWDVSVGQFFQQLSRKKHVVPKMFDLPKEWTRYCGIDYGHTEPFAVCWCASDNDGRLWFYREINAKQVNAPDQAKLILGLEHRDGDEVLSRAADPSMWGARGTPLSIADIYALEGCGIMKADNDRLNGWSRVHQYLNDAPACEYHRSPVDMDGNPKEPLDSCPMIHFFEDRVPMTIETMFGLPRSDTRPEDCQTTNVEDHLPDALRYLCMSVGTSSRPVIFNTDRENLSIEDIEALEAEERSSYDPHAGRAPLVGGLFAGSTRMPRPF